MVEYYLNNEYINTDGNTYIRKEYVIPFEKYAINIILNLSFFYKDDNNNYLNIKFFTLKYGDATYSKGIVPEIFSFINKIKDVVIFEGKKIEKESDKKISTLIIDSKDVRKRFLYERMIKEYVKEENINYNLILNDNKRMIINLK